MDGSGGPSVNFYDRASRRWRHASVDDRGGSLELDGAGSGSNMILAGERHDPKNGARVPHRIAWIPNADGSVRQRWRLTRELHGTWEIVFNGLDKRSS